MSTSGRIFTSKELTSDVELTTDYVVIGSGAGGAVAAATLAKGGAKVVILEEGGLYTRQDFSMRESTAYQNLYQERGNRATEDLAVIILQGRSVGGGTTVNWTTAFRTPEHVLEHWQKVHGVEGFGQNDLKSAFEAVEERLGIHRVDESQVNENNLVLLSGARNLGLSPELLRRNTRGCMRTGYCGTGCPVNAKQAMHLTYLPDALSAGAALYANTRVVDLVTECSRVTEVEAVVMDDARYQPGPRRVRVKASRVILAGGAINSPALLLRSRLKDSSGLVGRRTFLHPVAVVLGFHERPIRGFSGVPQSVGLREGVDRATPDRMGFFVETPPIHPLMAALACPGFGEQHAEIMARLDRVSALIALCIDGFNAAEPCGTVRVEENGRIKLSYAFHERFWQTVRQSTRLMVELALAGGAEEVWTTHETPLRIAKKADLTCLDKAEFGPLRQTLASAHQMGGCQMGGRPQDSVVNAELRHWDYDNLYIIDGSVLPTAAAVNPSETIYAMAHLAAGRLLQRHG